jgi:hypothetical protein
MKEWAARLLERYLRMSEERTENTLHVIGIVGASTLFVLAAVMIVASDAFFSSGRSVSALQIGDIAQQNIHAPVSLMYVSEVLTERSQEEAASQITQVYDSPDPNVARQQTQLARQILDFIKNVRRDPYASADQKVEDIKHITALQPDETVIRGMLAMNEETWQAVDDQVINVLERVMRETIRETDISSLTNQLPTQVSIRFSPDETDLIVAIVKDLVRPNTFPNPEATEMARQAARGETEPATRTFTRNEIVVREGKVIDAVDYEALDHLGLLKSGDLRSQEIIRAFLASVLVLIITGLYVSRFKPVLYGNSRFMLLLAVIFLIMLLGVRLSGATGQVYLFPTAALALLFASIAGPQIAFIGTMDLALLTGLMLNNSLEMAVLVCIGGFMGILVLRRTERLNNFFMGGLVIGLSNTLVVTIFNLGGLSSSNAGYELSVLVFFSLLNGILAAATAIAGMYVVTLLFNLPTSLKLTELSQPSQPLLQRLLREAPGTYQHSLQVANLSEQAALAIGADAELVRVAALYHDIGKVLNPAFFTENQQFGGGNPHDVLNDPYRSADIIISHVTEGDEIAEQYHLPSRIRDFIREHHGTTQVYYFYRKAVDLAEGDESSVDISEFTYPGPRPQSRETAIMMIADSCEAVVRSRGPASRQEISEIVEQIIEGKMHDSQLDESGLTLNDLKAIRNIFVEMLQAVFHPRINYPAETNTRIRRPDPPSQAALSMPKSDQSKASQEIATAQPLNENGLKRQEKRLSGEFEAAKPELIETEGPVDDDDKPLAEVPMLPRTSEHPAVKLNGKTQEVKTQPAKDHEVNE